MTFLRCNTICSVLIPVSVILLSQSVMAAHESPRNPFHDDDGILALEIASDYGECLVCYQPLYERTPTVFTISKQQRDPAITYNIRQHFYGSGNILGMDNHRQHFYGSDGGSHQPGRPEDSTPKRSCRHIYCQDCANSIAGTNPECPECRTPFSGCMAIPNLFEDPKGWFDTIDFDGDKALSQQEITDVLKCYFSVDPKALEQHLEKNWPKWDADKNGTICLSEFMQHLLPFLQETHKTLEGMKDYSDIPDWRHNPEAWFDFWDYDKSEELERPEVVRALAKTLKGVSTKAICNILEALWGDFDSNGDGGIDKDEFVKPNGLLTMLKLNLPAAQAAASSHPSAPPARPAHLPSLPRGWEELKEVNSEGQEITIFRNVRTGAIQYHRPTEEDKKTNDGNSLYFDF